MHLCLMPCSGGVGSLACPPLRFLLQIAMLLVGNVTMINSTFGCPVSSRFIASAQFYGPQNHFISRFPEPWNPQCPYAASVLQFGCQPCEAGTYAVNADSSSGAVGAVSNFSCLPCPVGGLCGPGGLVTAEPGYWGAVDGDAAIVFTQCPLGYCCSSLGSCSAGIDSCSGHRTGALCGDCAPGYSIVVGSVDCFPTTSCTSNLGWMSLLLVVGVFAAALVLLYVSDVVLPSRSVSKGNLRIVAYFWQMVQVVQLPNLESDVTSFLAAVLSVIRLQIPQSSRVVGFCVSSGRTKVLVEGLTPLAVGVAMAVLIGMMLAVNRVRGGWRQTGPPLLPRPVRRTKAHSLESLNLSVNVDTEAAVALIPRSFSVLPAGPVVPDLDADEHYVDDPTNMTFRARVASAGIMLVLFVYGGLITTLVSLLHCVTVPGAPPSDTFLFIQGSVRCNFGGWQAGYVLLLAVFIAFPLLAPVLAWRTMRSVSDSSCIADFHVGFRRALVGAYSAQLYWWESVLLLHRVLLAVLFTFGSSKPLQQALVAVAVCMLFALLHTHFRPMRDRTSNLLQQLLLVCLLVVALARVPYAAQVSAAVATRTLSDEGYVVLTLLFGYVIPGVGALAVVALPWLRARFLPGQRDDDANS